MEEKTTQNSRSVWSVFGLRIFRKLFFRSSDNANNSKFHLGFTLIELVVVIALIGILSTSLIVLINPKVQIQKANDNKRKADLRQIQAGLEIYRSDKGGYPLDSAQSNAVPNSGTSLVDTPGAVTATYIQNVPKDPTLATNYFYCTTAACTGASANCAAAPCGSYALYACLENASDTSSENSSRPTGMAACTSGKYYRVLNP